MKNKLQYLNEPVDIQQEIIRLKRIIRDHKNTYLAMKEILEKIIPDKSLVDKIIKSYQFHGTMSKDYLDNKFRFSAEMCNTIMAKIKEWENQNRELIQTDCLFFKNF